MQKAVYLSIISGILLGVSWPTWGFPIVLFIAFVPLLLAQRHLSEGTGRKVGWKVFGLSYLSFFIWNLWTTWWIVNSTVFGGLFAVLVNSLLFSTVFQTYHWVSKRLSPKLSLLYISAAWLSFEKLHLVWDFSWPWLNLGNGFSEYFKWIQWYEFTGSFGGSLWVWIVNLFFFEAIVRFKNTRDYRTIRWPLIGGFLCVVLPIILSLALYKWRSLEKGAAIQVLIVQPNVDPYSEKYSKKNLEVLQTIEQMCSSFLTEETDLVIAPETVFAESFGLPLSTFMETELQDSIQNMLENYPELHFLAGIQLYQPYFSPDTKTTSSNRIKEQTWIDFYNSALMMRKEKPWEVYHKSKLVVGVETMPFKSILEPLLGNFLLDLGGTIYTRATQDERTPLGYEDDPWKVGSIICYESVYGEFVTEYVRNGASILAIMTNDGWWKNSPGHRQHLSYARLRAIETRRDIARSANTGISARITALGEIENYLPYNTQGVISTTIYAHEELTFYVKHGDYIPRLALLLTGILALFSLVRPRR